MEKNSVILNYDESSENLFKWYQQLTAESLGKKNKGIFPVISSMPKDNHSLLSYIYMDQKTTFSQLLMLQKIKQITLKTDIYLTNFQI